MKTTFSWRPGKKFLRPPKRKFEELCKAAAEVSGSGIRGIFAVSFVNPEEMAQINQDCVGHTGPTDVITFDYRESAESMPGMDDEDCVEVELIICPEVALKEASKRALPYSREVTLYLVHGLLHSAGEDDLVPEKKRKMRAAEKRCLKALEKKHDFSKVFRKAPEVLC